MSAPATARRRRRLEQRLGELTAQFVSDERLRIGQHGGHFLAQPRLVAAAKNELADEIDCAPLRFAQRHAEANEFLSVHGFNMVELSLRWVSEASKVISAESND
jgi:hypothetical protein